MDDRIASDALFALRAKVRQARMMTPQMKFRAGAELFEEACLWTMAGIKARMPNSSEQDRIDQLKRQLKLQEGTMR